MKTNHLPAENSKNVQGVIIPPEKMRTNMKQIKAVIIKIEHHKTSKLQNDSAVSKSLTTQWIKVNDLLGGQYSVNKNIRFKIIRSDVFDYRDASIVVKGEVTVERLNDANKKNKHLIFKNNIPFKSCISKTSNIFIDNAEDLDIAIPF